MVELKLYHFSQLSIISTMIQEYSDLHFFSALKSFYSFCCALWPVLQKGSLNTKFYDLYRSLCVFYSKIFMAKVPFSVLSLESV